MKFKIITLVALTLLQGTLFNGNSVTLHTIGDSTMADQDESGEIRGWGQMFPQFFSAGVTVNNRGKSGASSKSFYKEAPYWQTVLKQIKEGDYVLIQFAHNDEKNGGLDGDTVRLSDPSADYRGTTAQGTFKTYLRAYVNETRALGAQPILATAMCRKYFSGNTITRKGRHDLGENFSVPESNRTYDYSHALSEIATEMNVPIIDLTAMTKELFESYGDAAATELLFTNDDSTHPSALGATMVARLCAQEMSKQGILAEYINSSSDLLLNPTTHDFGNAYIGQTLVKEFTISGFDLSPEAATVTLSVDGEFGISKDKSGPFSSSIDMEYTNKNVEFTKFYVSVNSPDSGAKTGNLTVENGTITKHIPLTATFIELTGGTEVKILWELLKDGEYTLSGPAMAVDQSFSNMYAQRYAQPNSNTITESEKWDVSRKMQRNLIEGDVWPSGDIDEVSTRYIQFGVTPNKGTELNIDSIGLFAAGAGGNGMKCRISYSVNNFSDAEVIQEFKSMVSNTVYEVSTIPVEKLSYGDTLLVRVYPWYGGEASGKTICLADVCIHGMANSTATPVSDVKTQEIKFMVAGENLIIRNILSKSKIEVFDLSSRNIYSSQQSMGTITLKTPQKNGVYICRISNAEGVETYKFIVR